MASPPLRRPGVLVLAAGGVLGEAWMRGLITALEDEAGIDFRECDHLVGTSAGSVVAAGILAARPPRRPVFPTDVPDPPPAAARQAGTTAAVLARATRFSFAVAAPMAGAALRAAAPAGAMTRAAMLGRLPRPRGNLSALGREIESRGARFDGRLRIAVVDRRSGRRVVFGDPDAPPAGVGEAVEASCAVPWLYRPVSIAGREYVDGGVWSPTNLDVAPVQRGTEVLCLNPSGRFTRSATDPMNLVRAAARPAAAVEAMVLRRRGARVRIVDPDPEAAEAMGHDFMDPGPRERVLRAGWEQGRRLARTGGAG